MPGTDLRFRIEFGLELDPDGGLGVAPDVASSWGWFQIWVGPLNICRHVAQGQVHDRIHWYLLPLLEWFAENWDAIFQEQTKPLEDQGSARETYLASLGTELAELLEDRVYGWWSRHSIRAAASGGIFPDLFLCRQRDSLEVSWGHSIVAGAPSDLRFLEQSGSLLVPAAETAAAIHAELSKLVQGLQAMNPESIRIQQLNDGLESLLRPESERVQWLSPIPAVQQLAQGYLSNTASLTIAHIPAPVTLFGSLSPNVSEKDVETLIGLMTTSSTEVSSSIAMVVELLTATPWEQGYELAEIAAAKFVQYQNEDAVEIEGILSGIGVAVMEVELTDRGIRAVALCGAGWKPQIAVNQSCGRNTTPPGRRFTLAHELCHLLFDQEFGSPLAIASGPWAPKKIEQRANAFAAAFLIPSGRVQEHSGQWTIEAILDAARRFQVGRLPLINHLKNLNLITSTESDDLEEALSRLTENSWSS